MPLNKGWREAVEQDIETPLDEETLKSVEERISRLRDELDLYGSPAWAHLDAKLEAEFRRHSDTLFMAEDVEELKLSRERARVVARLRKMPEAADTQLQELSRERRVLLGEEEEEPEE